MRPARWWAGLVALVLVLAACGGDDDSTVTIYTSVTQATVDAVVSGFETENSDVTVEVFRAPTGEVAARLEAERRTGDVGADVLWLTDPLSMYQYTPLLDEWEPAGSVAVPGDARTESFWGTRVLYLTIVVPQGNPAGLSDWSDLTDPALRVAIPDPRFAGSAFAALGFFGLDPEYGLEFYEDLKAGGAVQVSSPGDVVTGVAEGQFDAGLTLEFSARTAAGKGSPIEVVWPASAAIAVTSPVAVLAEAAPGDDARDFVEFVLSQAGQEAIATTGWTPILDGAGGPGPPVTAAVVYPDWASIVARQGELVDGYSAIFGG